MIKPKNPLFNKTLSKHIPKQPHSDQIQAKKTRRSYFKLNKTNLSTIIKNLQHSVKQLKHFHESLHKTSSIKLHKSSSLHQINKLKSTVNFKTKESTTKNNIFKKQRMINDENKQNISSNINHPGIDSMVSKNFYQNGSTMLSIQNADVDQVKKAYHFAYGRQTTNIVDLYNFFKKNSDKSMRFNHGSIEISSLPHVQHSEDMAKSRQNIYHRKSNEILNVIIQDNSQKEPRAVQNQTEKSCSFSISKLSGVKNPTIEEIFKGGCPDLANVYDFVKKRRISLKNYINLNQHQKQNKPFVLNQLEKLAQQKDDRNEDQKQDEQTDSKNKQITIEKDNFQYELGNQQSPCVQNLVTKRNKSQTQEGILSEQKYFPSKSSKKSQKSSIKKSKKKQNQIDLDQNILSEAIDQFNLAKILQNQSHKTTKRFKHQDLNENVLDFDSFLMSNDKRYQEDQMKNGKKNKQQSFDGSSISVRSCSRIIDLDFIPLDI